MTLFFKAKFHNPSYIICIMNKEDRNLKLKNKLKNDVDKTQAVENSEVK